MVYAVGDALSPDFRLGDVRPARAGRALHRGGFGATSEMAAKLRIEEWELRGVGERNQDVRVGRHGLNPL